MHSVLIVEDDHDVRSFMECLLEYSGYETHSAENGALGLQAMRDKHPCVVLLDLMMPVMDGWEFRRQQLADDELAKIPVVCLTAAQRPEEIASSLGLPCLQKPAPLDELVRIVAELCESHASGDAARTEHKASAPQRGRAPSD